MTQNREIGFVVGWADEGEEEANFLQNIRFVEFWHRQLHPKGRYTLRERLDSIASELLPFGAIDVITDCYDALAVKIVDSRNYLTHLDPKKEPKALEGDALRVATLKLGILLLFHTWLKDYGEDFVKKMVSSPSSPFVRKHLDVSDKPDDKQFTIWPKSHIK